MASADYITKAELRSELEVFGSEFEAKMDAKFEVWAEKLTKDIVGQISDVLNDMMIMINERFDKLEDKVDHLSVEVNAHCIEIRRLKRHNGLV